MGLSFQIFRSSLLEGPFGNAMPRASFSYLARGRAASSVRRTTRAAKTGYERFAFHPRPSRQC